MGPTLGSSYKVLNKKCGLYNQQRSSPTAIFWLFNNTTIISSYTIIMVTIVDITSLSYQFL